MPDKKFKDTKVGKWVTNKVPVVTDAVGDLLPDQGVLGVVKRVVAGSTSLTAEEKMEFEKLAAEQEINAQEQVTRRWEADSRGDVKLAQYIRPVTLIALTLFFMTVMVWDGLDQEFMPPSSYISLLEILMLTVFGAYFAGRTIEKVRK